MMFYRPAYVVDKVFDLFSELGATDAQMDFQIVYASGTVLLTCVTTQDNTQPKMRILSDAMLLRFC